MRGGVAAQPGAGVTGETAAGGVERVGCPAVDDSAQLVTRGQGVARRGHLAAVGMQSPGAMTGPVVAGLTALQKARHLARPPCGVTRSSAVMEVVRLPDRVPLRQSRYGACPPVVHITASLDYCNTLLSFSLIMHARRCCQPSPFQGGSPQAT